MVGQSVIVGEETRKNEYRLLQKIVIISYFGPQLKF